MAATPRPSRAATDGPRADPYSAQVDTPRGRSVKPRASRSAALLVAIILLGCGAPSVTTTSTPAPSGGTLRVVAVENGAEQAPGRPFYDWSDVFSLNPVVTCCLFRTLLSYNGRGIEDGGVVLRPDLAAALPEVSADGLAWTFRLKPGIRYGPPLQDRVIESRDFVTAIEYAVRRGAPFYEDINGVLEFRDGLVDTIAGLEAPDATTLVVRLVAPAGDLGNRLALGSSAPLPAEVLAGRTDDEVPGFPVASGPYMFEGATQQDLADPAAKPIWTIQAEGPAALVRNPSWDRATDTLRSAVFDRIELTMAATSEAAAALVDRGDVDVMAEPAPAEVAQRYLDDASLAERVHVQQSLQLRYISMNIALPPLDDVHVRRAVGLVLDRATMASTLTAQRAILTQVAQHAMPDALQNNLLVGYAPVATPGEHGDLEAARAEMRLSAYDANGDGTCDDPTCADLPLMGPAEPGSVQEQLVAAVAQLGLGLVPSEGNIFSPEDHVAMAVIGWQADYPNGANFAGLFGTRGNDQQHIDTSLIGSSPDELAGWGYTVTSVPTLGPRIDTCLAAVGADGFRCWATLDQLVMERIVPWVPIATVSHAWITSPRVVAFSPDAASAGPSLDQIRLAAGS
jgi:peptide/nickel transport system substrate-binding protein